MMESEYGFCKKKKELFEAFRQERHDYKDIVKVYGQGDTGLQAMAFFKGFDSAIKPVMIETLEEVLRIANLNSSYRVADKIEELLIEIKQE